MLDVVLNAVVLGAAVLNAAVLDAAVLDAGRNAGYWMRYWMLVTIWGAAY